MQYCHLHKGVKTINEEAISCKNLVNFGPVTSENVLICGGSTYGYWVKIALQSPFVTLGFPNALDD